MSLAHRAGDGGKKARSPRRARRKPLKPLRREGRLKPPLPVATTLVCFFHCTRGRGCSGHPVFPAPSIIGGTKNSRITRTLVAPREGRCASLFSFLNGWARLFPSWPGIAVRRTAPLALAYARPTTSFFARGGKDVDVRVAPAHDKLKDCACCRGCLRFTSG